ncbi:MAG: translation initiation factor IF-2, partial [Candidatus Hadarchaeales archaeon]
VAAPGLEGVVAGAPFQVVESEEEANRVWEEMQAELESVKISSDINGVVVKADAIGSLEAIEGQLENKSIPIRLADIGSVSKRDVVEAATVSADDLALGVVLAFNVDVLEDAAAEAEKSGIEIMRENVIYRLIENYEEWAKRKREEVREKKLEVYVRPAKVAVKPGYVFRRSEPAIVGVDILGGVLRPKAPLMKADGKRIGVVRELQKEKKPIQVARLGDELAISIEGGVVGRNMEEGDVLYTDVPRDHVLVFKRDLREVLSGDELAVLDEIISIKRQEDPTYGVL